MSPALIAIAAQFGVPLIRQILNRKIGGDNAELAEGLINVIARRLGLPLGTDPITGIENMASSDPDRVRDTMREVESSVAPGLVAVYQAEAEERRQIMAAEAAEPTWYRAWRPIGMYVIGFLWLWNIVLLHVANAIWKIALPQMDLAVLLQLSALYMSLYMGGHTVKAISESWSHK